MTTPTTAPAPTAGDFTRTYTFISSPDAVYDAITTVAGITAWWAPTAGSGETNGTLEVTFGPSSSVRLDVATADRPRLVVWDVPECIAMPDWVGTSIYFALSATGEGGTTLHFTHVGLAELECLEQCTEGWTRHLRSLVSLVDTGVGAPIVLAS